MAHKGGVARDVGTLKQPLELDILHIIYDLRCEMLIDRQ